MTEQFYRIEWIESFWDDLTEGDLYAIIDNPDSYTAALVAAAYSKLAQLDAERAAAKTVRERATETAVEWLRSNEFPNPERFGAQLVMVFEEAGLLAPDEPLVAGILDDGRGCRRHKREREGN